MYTLEITGSRSKLSIQFPEMCCCCGDAKVDGHYRPVTFVRVSKRKSIAETHPWKFPICQKCLDWINADSSPALLTLIFVVALPLPLLTFFATGLGIAFLLASHPLAGIPLLLIGLIFFGLFLIAFKFTKSRQSRADKIKPKPICHRFPVMYKGWNNNIHTFEFTNPDFCKSLKRLN